MKTQEFKKGTVVQIFDNGTVKLGVVTEDGIDNKNRVRVRPKNYPMDMSIPIDQNNKLHIITEF